MFRWLRRFFILWILALLVLPVVKGYLISSQAPDALARLDARLDQADFGKPIIDRGWFSTHILMDITPASDDRTIEMEAQIDHGPLSYLRARWLSGQLQFRTNEAGQEALATVDVDLSAILNLSSEIVFDTDTLNGRVEIESGQFANEWTLRLLDVDYQEVGNIQLARLNGEVILHTEQSPEFRVKVHSDRLQLDSLDQTMDRPSLELDFDREGALGELSLNWKAGRLVSAVSEIQDVRYQSVTSQLHIPSMIELMRATRESIEAGYTGEVLNRQLMTNLFFVLPGLVNALPGHRLDELSYSGPSGMVDINGDVKLTDTPQGGYLSDPSMLLDVTRAELSMRMPERQMRELLVDWVRRQNPDITLQEEVIAVDLIMDRYSLLTTNDRSSLDLSYQDSTLLINGVENL